MKRKVISMLLCATMAVSMVGCGGGSGDAPASTPAESEGGVESSGETDAPADSGAASGGGTLEAFTPADGSPVAVNSIYKPAADPSDWTIAVVVKDSSNGWFVRMEEGVKQFADDYGINAYQKGPVATDAAQQVEVIENQINQDIDAICVVPVDPATCDTVLQDAKDKGIKVICHEGSSANCDIDLEAFSNAGYGAYIMDNLAEAMGEEGTYVTMVAHLTNASQNEWADGAVARAEEAYPNLVNLEASPRVESENNSERAYEVAKEVLKTYPEVKGFVGTSSMDTPGIARAIDELGLNGKVFVCGTGMPNECRELIKSGSIHSAQLWDPAEAGYAMCVMATMMLDGQTIGAGTDLGLASYSDMIVNADNSNIVEGAGWISLKSDNVDNYNF